MRYPDGRQVIVPCEPFVSLEYKETRMGILKVSETAVVMTNKTIPEGSVLLDIYSPDVSHDPAKPGAEYSPNSVLFTG